MNEPLPRFRYHPNPLATGSITASDAACVCCGRTRGYVYTASTYSRHYNRDDSLCPWCIASGEAALRFDLTFSDDIPLLHAGVPETVIAEVCARTPGYASWQQECWLSCCGDACAFDGDARPKDIAALGAEGLARHFPDYPWPAATWQRLVANYQPGGNPAIYHFICLHCGVSHYGLDFT